MTQLFLSYRRDDTAAAAGRLYDRLTPRFGRDSVFIDVDAIPFGADVREHIRAYLSKCQAVLAVIGSRWAGVGPDGTRRIDDPDDFVRIELETAFELRIPVIPVLVDRIGIPTNEELPSTLVPLANRNAAQIENTRDFHDHVNRLIEAIEDLLGLERMLAADKQREQFGAWFSLVPREMFDADAQDVSGTFWLAHESDAGSYRFECMPDGELRYEDALVDHYYTDARWLQVGSVIFIEERDGRSQRRGILDGHLITDGEGFRGDGRLYTWTAQRQERPLTWSPA